MEHDYNYKLKTDKMRNDIIYKIKKLLPLCADVSLLDLIMKLLEKSV